MTKIYIAVFVVFLITTVLFVAKPQPTAKTGNFALYEHYFKTDNAEKTLTFFHAMKSEKKKLMPSGGGCFPPPPPPGYYYQIKETNVFEENPGALAFRIALEFEDPQTRFKTLRKLLHLAADQSINTEICSGKLSDCIWKELLELHKNEEDESVSNTMLLEIALDKANEGNIQAAIDYLNKLKERKGNGLVITAIVNQPACISYIDQIPELAQNIYETSNERASAQNLATCYASSGEYKKILGEIDRLGEARDPFLQTVALALYRQKKYDQWPEVIALIENPKIRRWEATLPFRNLPSHFSLEESPEKRAQMLAELRKFITRIESIPLLKDDKELWRQIVRWLNRELSRPDVQKIAQEIMDEKALLAPE